MASFYKHDIAAWRGGTASLTHEQYRVYHVLVEQMMLDEGSILVHERMLAGLSNMSTRAFRSALDELVQLGKVVRHDERLSNLRVQNELSGIFKNRQNAALGGRSRPVRDHFERKKEPNSPRTLDEPSPNGPPSGPDVQRKPNDFNGDGEAVLTSASKPKREEKSKTREERDIEDLKERSSHPKPAVWGSFEEFWMAYPAKVGKEAARRKFSTVGKSGRVKFTDLMTALETYKARKPHDRPWCYPTTWLSQGRWEDEHGAGPDERRRNYASV